MIMRLTWGTWRPGPWDACEHTYKATLAGKEIRGYGGGGWRGTPRTPMAALPSVCGTAWRTWGSRSTRRIFYGARDSTASTPDISNCFYP